VGDSLIAKSGQLGSFRYGVASLVAGTIVMMVAPRIHDTIPIYIGYPVGVVLAIGAAVFLVTSIRCPRCRARSSGARCVGIQATCTRRSPAQVAGRVDIQSTGDFDLLLQIEFLRKVIGAT